MQQTIRHAPVSINKCRQRLKVLNLCLRQLYDYLFYV